MAVPVFCFIIQACAYTKALWDVRICEDNHSINYWDWFANQQSKVHMMSHKSIDAQSKQNQQNKFPLLYDSMINVKIHKSMQSIQSLSRSVKPSSYSLRKHSQLPNMFLLDVFFWSLHLGNVLKFKDMTIWNTGQIIKCLIVEVGSSGMVCETPKKNTFDSIVK